MDKVFISIGKNKQKKFQPDFDLDLIKEIGSNALNGAFAQTKFKGTFNLKNLEIIRESGMYSCFQNSTGIKEISFESLTTIEKKGMSLCFQSNKEIQKVYFPKLITIFTSPNIFSKTNGGLYKIFENSSLKEVHFSESLSSHKQCTASNLGCSSSCVFFDLPLIETT